MAPASSCRGRSFQRAGSGKGGRWLRLWLPVRLSGCPSPTCVKSLVSSSSVRQDWSCASFGILLQTSNCWCRFCALRFAFGCANVCQSFLHDLAAFYQLALKQLTCSWNSTLKWKRESEFQIEFELKWEWWVGNGEWKCQVVVSGQRVCSHMSI